MHAPGSTRLPADGRKSLRQWLSKPAVRSALQALAGWLAALGASPVRAEPSMETLGTVADVLTIIVLIIVPLIGIVVFWMVHVLPEKIAEKRHHPQRDAITTLCLLSLVFGGLLWPLAWLWTFTRPVGYRAAYGTDKHEDYYEEMGERHRAGSLVREEILHLREDLEAMETQGALPPKLRALKEELARVGPEEASVEAPAGANKGGRT